MQAMESHRTGVTNTLITGDCHWTPHAENTSPHTIGYAFLSLTNLPQPTNGIYQPTVQNTNQPTVIATYGRTPYGAVLRP